MVPLYSARIENLGPGDTSGSGAWRAVTDELLTVDQLRVKGLCRVLPETLVMDLERRFRCRECDARGRRSYRLGGVKLNKALMVLCGVSPPEGVTRVG